MPHYGLVPFPQAPPSPPLQHRTILHRPGNNGSLMASGAAAAIGQIPIPTSNGYRPHAEDKRLTRDAMEKYMQERNDMVIVILHAKVNLNTFLLPFQDSGQPGY